MTSEERRLDLRRRQLAVRLATMATLQKQPSPQADMSAAGRFRDNIFGVQDGVQSTGEKIAAWLNKGGESLTMGVVGDEAAAATDAMLGRGGYDQRRDQYRQQEAQLEAENPGAALAADVGGGRWRGYSWWSCYEGHGAWKAHDGVGRSRSRTRGACMGSPRAKGG